jgi:hypothetical protein
MFTAMRTAGRPAASDADELAAGEIHFGLVMQHEFLLVQRLAQLILQGELAGHGFAHALRVEQVSIAARLGFF